MISSVCLTEIRVLTLLRVDEFPSGDRGNSGRCGLIDVTFGLGTFLGFSAVTINIRFSITLENSRILVRFPCCSFSIVAGQL